VRERSHDVAGARTYDALDARHEPALAALEGLYEKLGRWPELAAHLRARLAVTADRREAARLHDKLGMLLGTRLGNAAEAVRSYLAVLDADPRNRKALEALRGLGLARLYPGHGPLVEDAPAKLAEYVAHRLEREREVLAALAAGDRTPGQVVARVYAGVPLALHPAAERSVRAHLDKLVADGRVAAEPGGGFRPA